MGEGDLLEAWPESESRQVMEQVIIPAATRGAVRQSHSVVVVVAGQPGAGKTEIADLVQATLGRRGGAVRICRDLYKAAHRRYRRHLATDVRTAGVRVRPDTSRLQAAIEDHVRVHGVPVRTLSPAANGGDLARVSPVWVSPGSYSCAGG
ncbi:zeta toxin family protein [Streptomyces sp. TG1A-8]|uniref:zeta toxin family protein n=1 Tax=Streptomyces sp. TG1A-8 TaxID=3051385 RepID=UPI00265BBE88|nr:zeta toxin family protein [Streptomyces sp. TG1A-8]MDO0929891.1 zeta toxin family protein [Streptomyces sp. TG1A-8]